MNNKDFKVLLISPLPPPAGGIASWTKKYLIWAKSNYINVDIVNTAVIGNRAIRINDKRNLLDEIIRTKEIIKELKRKIAVYRPDIIHMNSSCGKFGIIRDYLCALIIRNKKIPLIIHYRCNIKDQIDDNKFQNYIFKKLTKTGTLILVLNNSSRELVDKITEKKSRLIANFIEKDFIIKEPKFIRSDIKEIVFIGHVQRTKGVIEIIKSAKFFPEITFTLAGPISHEISSLEVPKNIRLLGLVNQMKAKELLSHADVFLFPTYTEGFSNALLEAMAMGVPVITTPVGANVDMIEQFGGILVEVRSVTDIINVINKMKSSKLRKKMSLWNIRKVENSYIIDRLMNDLVEIYKRVLKSEEYYENNI